MEDSGVYKIKFFNYGNVYNVFMGNPGETSLEFSSNMRITRNGRDLGTMSALKNLATTYSTSSPSSIISLSPSRDDLVSPPSVTITSVPRNNTNLAKPTPISGQAVNWSESEAQRGQNDKDESNSTAALSQMKKTRPPTPYVNVPVNNFNGSGPSCFQNQGQDLNGKNYSNGFTGIRGQNDSCWSGEDEVDVVPSAFYRPSVHNKF